MAFRWSLLGSERSVVGDVLDDVVDIVSVFAVVDVGASSHKLKKTDNWHVQLFIVRVSAVDIWKLALSNRVVDARVFSQVVGVSALVPIGAVVFVVQLLAGLLGWFGPVNLSSESVGEVAAESVLAVSSVVMNAGVKASIDVFFTTVLFTFAFFDCKVLIGAEVLDHFELAFEFLVLEEFFVVHFFVD